MVAKKDAPKLDFAGGKLDILGRQLIMGQQVAFNPPKYKGITIGHIAGFTEKMVRVKYRDHMNRIKITVVYARDCAIL